MNQRSRITRTMVYSVQHLIWQLIFVSGGQDLHDEMLERIDTSIMSGKIPEEIKLKHKGFKEWNSEITSKNHQPIVQVGFNVSKIRTKFFMITK